MIYKYIAFSVCILGLFQAIPLRAQEAASGIYLSTGKSGNCQQKVKFYGKDKEFLCLTEMPIIPETEFLMVSEIQTDSIQNIRYVDLWISRNSFANLKLLSSKLPNNELVLVLDHQVAGIFDPHLDQLPTNFIRITGALNSWEIFWIYENLKKSAQYHSFEEMKAREKVQKDVLKN